MEGEESYLDFSFINSLTLDSLLTSQYAKVIFHDIQEKYDVNKDLICQYYLTKQFNANSGDRVVLYRLGWQQVTDYVLFEWVTIPPDSSTFEVKFEANDLPRDKNEFYQLCYISCENAVCGASIPFQFSINREDLKISTDSDWVVSVKMDSSQAIESTSGVSTLEDSLVRDGSEPESMLKLNKSENEVMKMENDNETIKQAIEQTNRALEDCDSQIIDLKKEIETLKNMLRVTQKDVSDLKMRMDIANDEYKKLYSEKARVEKKYDKLVKKCQSKSRNKSVDSESDMCDFLGELEPLPPFPILM